jgi:sugar phosphate isomerase/epimerase
MYVALNRTLVSGKSVDWDQLTTLAADRGFIGTDVDLAPAMQDGVEATKKMLADRKLKPAVIGLPVDFRNDDETFARTLTQLKPAADFAVAIGCPRISTWVMSSSDTPKKQRWATLRERFKICADIMARRHVRFGLEFLGPLHIRKARKHEFIWNMEEMLQLAVEAGPNVGVLLDSWHWHHAGGTIDEIVQAGKERIIHVQVADAPDLPPDKIVDSERLFPGEGIIDFDGFFKALKKINYEDAVSPEVFGRNIKAMTPDHGADLGLVTTQIALKRAGITER